MLSGTEPGVSTSSAADEPDENDGSRCNDLLVDNTDYNSDDFAPSPWARKTVLAFDGGGIRGYSSLLILQCLMTKIMEEENKSDIYSSGDYPWMAAKTPPVVTPGENNLNAFLPCHYFDYITGTSTGGLSAIMLGRLRMSVNEALDQYRVFGNAIFGQPRRWNEKSFPLWWPRAKYSSRKTREVFQRIILNKLGNAHFTDYDAEEESFAHRDDQTRTIVFSYSMNKTGVGMVYLWRTFDHKSDSGSNNPLPLHLNPSAAHNDAIWKVARATSAAPTFFESIRIKGEKHFDGGMGANNPSWDALHEIQLKHSYAPELFLSIGCGIKPRAAQSQPKKRNIWGFSKDRSVDSGSRKQFLNKYLEIGRSGKDFIVNPEGPMGKEGWEAKCRDIEVTYPCRLNVQENLTDIALDDWRPSRTGEDTLTDIQTRTMAYLETREIQDEIGRMAKELVKIRRQRAKTERWESFSSDVYYFCSRCTLRFSTRDGFRMHVKRNQKHTDITEKELDNYLDEGRQFT